jgi:uncharacterized membrane protein
MKTAARIQILLLFFFIVLAPVILASTMADSHLQHKAIFFYKPDCKPCEKLHREILPDIKKSLGERLTILSLNTADPEGGKLYLGALIELGIPYAQPLPIIVLGRHYWSGEQEITRHLLEMASDDPNGPLSKWPAISGLDKLLDRIQLMSESDKKQWFISTNPGTLSFIIADMKRKFRQDIAGNSYAVIALISMILAVGLSIFLFFCDHDPEIGVLNRWFILMLAIFGIAITWQLAEVDAIIRGQKAFLNAIDDWLSFWSLVGMVIGFAFTFHTLFVDRTERIKFWQRWAIPLFLTVSVIASGYLTFLELIQTEAVCGALGDCNAVQKSPYSSLFGIISIAGFGMLGNAMILISWMLGQVGPLKWRRLFEIVLWGLLVIGTGFFIYLTFLEPFVIGSTCFWCLTAAIAMTLQLLIATHPAEKARQNLLDSGNQ